eukprot:1136994-Pelagomonas_calceolata.AAC.2
MPVAVLLAYLWNSVYTDKASVLCSVPSGPSDPPELTDAEVPAGSPPVISREVKKGQDRAREFKKGLKTAEEQALFPSRKLDGKGHPLLFVASWQALQLVLSKAKNLFAAAAFWKANKEELIESFPPPTAYLQLQQHVTKFITVSSLGDCLISIEAQPDGSIFAVVKDWQSYEIFLSEYEAFTCADFYSHNTTYHGGMAHKLWRHGKAPWEKQGAGSSSECVSSIKGCGCTASIKASLQPKYAEDLKDTSASVDVSDVEMGCCKAVEVRIMPEHTGHSPEEDTTAKPGQIVSYGVGPPS